MGFNMNPEEPIVDANPPSGVVAPEKTENPPEWVKFNRPVRVQRSTGEIDGDWLVSRYDEGKVHVRKLDPARGLILKAIPLETLASLNTPEEPSEHPELPLDLKDKEMVVRRSSGNIDGGWLVDRYDRETGKVFLKKT